MKVLEVQARVDWLGYLVVLEDRTKIDILIDAGAVAILALRAYRNRSKRAVAGPCKAVVRKAAKA